MRLKTILVTGSSGLIGSEAVEHFDHQGHQVHGIDNNMRRVFFGGPRRYVWNLDRLRRVAKNFTHHHLDIRDRLALETLFRAQRFDLIVHCAAQPSHDKARDIPILDFEVNALGTVNLLETTRLHCPEAVFISNEHQQGVRRCAKRTPVKGTGDALGIRAARGLQRDHRALPRLIRTLHSLFGASKAYGGSDGSGIWPLFRDECVYFSRRMPDRAFAFGGGVTWFSFIPRKGGDNRRHLFRIWV